MIHAGDLDKRITFQSATEAADSEGQPVKTWANLSTTPTVWARFIAGDGRGEFASDAARIVAQRVGVFKIRHRTDLTEKMRIVYNSQNWNIHRIKESDRRNESLSIFASVEA